MSLAGLLIAVAKVGVACLFIHAEIGFVFVFVFVSAFVSAFVSPFALVDVEAGGLVVLSLAKGLGLDACFVNREAIGLGFGSEAVMELATFGVAALANSVLLVPALADAASWLMEALKGRCFCFWFNQDAKGV